MQGINIISVLCMLAFCKQISGKPRDQSIVLLFSPIFLSGSSFFLPIMLPNFNNLLKVKLYNYSYLTVTSYTHYIPQLHIQIRQL